MYDVVVVGAGPAGSSLALRLARVGYDVALLDRSRFPRSKACGDYLCAGGVRALQELGVSERVLAGAHPIHSVALHGFGEQIRFALPGDGALSHPRDLLDARLVEAALDAGAQLLHGSFMQAHAEHRHVLVRVRRGDGGESVLATRVLVGADGSRSVVAVRCGLARQGRNNGRWAVGGELRENTSSNELEMYVADEGYYARNPLGPTSVNSMLVLPKPARVEDADAAVAAITDGARRFAREKMSKRVAIGPLAYRADTVMRGRVLLTGDAAQFLDPFIGQGVTTALRLSDPAARAVHDLLAGREAERVGREYRSAWRAIVAPRRALGALVRTMVRVGWVRRRSLRNLRRDPALAQAMLSAVSDLVPARKALTSANLLRLLVA